MPRFRRGLGEHLGRCLQGQGHQEGAAIGEIIVRLVRGVQRCALESQVGWILRAGILLHEEAPPHRQSAT